MILPFVLGDIMISLGQPVQRLVGVHREVAGRPSCGTRVDVVVEFAADGAAALADYCAHDHIGNPIACEVPGADTDAVGVAGPNGAPLINSCPSTPLRRRTRPLPDAVPITRSGTPSPSIEGAATGPSTKLLGGVSFGSCALAPIALHKYTATARQRGRPGWLFVS
jgi:hypothetical protein